MFNLFNKLKKLQETGDCDGRVVTFGLEDEEGTVWDIKLGSAGTCTSRDFPTISYTTPDGEGFQKVFQSEPEAVAWLNQLRYSLTELTQLTVGEGLCN